MKLFRRKGYELSLNRVHDKVRISEGEDGILLTVDGDPARIVAGLTIASKKLQAINANSTDEDFAAAAQFFAEVMFGAEQAKKLMDFYRGDGQPVVTVCGRYFQERLSKLITKAQKKNG